VAVAVDPDAAVACATSQLDFATCEPIDGGCSTCMCSGTCSVTAKIAAVAAIPCDRDAALATALIDVAVSELVGGGCSTGRGSLSVTAKVAAIVTVSSDIDTAIASEPTCVTGLTDP
jgi:hypothetical protein